MASVERCITDGVEPNVNGAGGIPSDRRPSGVTRGMAAAWGKLLWAFETVILDP